MMRFVPRRSIRLDVFTGVAWIALGVIGATRASAADEKVVYRCPGNPILYTDSITAKEAKDKGCKTLEGAPITVIQAQKPRAVSTSPGTTSGTSRPADNRVDPVDQKARDSDAKRILEAELRKEDEKLGEMKKEFNNGEPERRGDERNYQKYIDRVADMKAALARKEADVAAIRRELSKFP